MKKKRKKAATKIQKIMRGKRTRASEGAVRRRRKKKATRKIQRIYRGRLGRRRAAVEALLRRQREWAATPQGQAAMAAAGQERPLDVKKRGQKIVYSKDVFDVRVPSMVMRDRVNPCCGKVRCEKVKISLRCRQLNPGTKKFFKIYGRFDVLKSKGDGFIADQMRKDCGNVLKLRILEAALEESLRGPFELENGDILDLHFSECTEFAHVFVFSVDGGELHDHRRPLLETFDGLRRQRQNSQRNAEVARMCTADDLLRLEDGEIVGGIPPPVGLRRQRGHQLTARAAAGAAETIACPNKACARGFAFAPAAAAWQFGRCPECAGAECKALPHHVPKTAVARLDPRVVVPQIRFESAHEVGPTGATGSLKELFNGGSIRWTPRKIGVVPAVGVKRRSAPTSPPPAPKAKKHKVKGKDAAKAKSPKTHGGKKKSKKGGK